MNRAAGLVAAGAGPEDASSGLPRWCDSMAAVGPLMPFASPYSLAAVVAAAFGVGAWTSSRARRLDGTRAVAEAERSALARRIERLTTSTTDMVFVADGEQRLVEANERAVALLGYSREQLLGMHVQELRDPATLADYPDRVRQQTEHGAALFETRYRRRDGTVFPVQVSVHAELYEGRRYFEAIARDLTDAKLAEEALRASEGRFRAVFDCASVGILLAGADGRVVEANPSFRELTGYTEAELRGFPTAALYDPEDGARSEAVGAQMASGQLDRFELPRLVRRKDGTKLEAMVRASALRDGAGALRFIIALVEDVSEKRRMESRLLLADRMASVGTLAAGVAHEINNPLAFILSNLDFALEEVRRTGVEGELLRSLEDAKDGGVRVREIVRDLKTFARPTEEAYHHLDVRRVLQSAVGLASNELRHRARVVVDPGDVPPVLADEHRLAQVFVNLLINAAHAIPEGNIQANEVRVTTSTASDGSALVEISDTGAGIAPEVLPRIFDPFFTTKPVGVGTGLGLSICHGIVAQLGGEIRVESTLGEGSTFRVRLPAAAAAAETAPRPADPVRAKPPGRRGRVLVVDDEPLVGRAVWRMLAPHHDVVVLTSARAALDRLAVDAGSFDVVLCDIMMPDMTGMELHVQLSELAPGLAARTIFLTGGAFTPTAGRFLERIPNPRLEKPFEPQALRDLVARALALVPERAA